jgi:pimeloyl-ACP methyl ester carboxylesterase
MRRSLFLGLPGLLWSGLLFSGVALAGKVYDSFPTDINPGDKYVFYSHGFLLEGAVEGADATPTHPQFGKYDFPAIKRALSDVDYHLIAYLRPADTRPREFAQKLAQDVEGLILAGVQPENITLLGFSRGGAISILASNELKSARINTIILAGCAGLVQGDDKLQVYGKVLSIYETSDEVGSCQFLFDRSPALRSFAEIAISTGKSHGAFYTPEPAWVIPVKAFIKSSPE